MSEHRLAFLKSLGVPIPDVSRTIRQETLETYAKHMPSAEPCRSRVPALRIHCARQFIENLQEILLSEQKFAASQEEANTKVVIDNDNKDIAIEFDIFVNKKVYSAPGYVVTIKNLKRVPFSAAAISRWREEFPELKITPSRDNTIVYIQALTVQDILDIVYEIMPMFFKNNGMDTLSVEILSYVNKKTYRMRFVIASTGQLFPEEAPAEGIPKHGSSSRSGWHR